MTSARDAFCLGLIASSDFCEVRSFQLHSHSTVSASRTGFGVASLNNRAQIKDENVLVPFPVASSLSYGPAYGTEKSEDYGTEKCKGQAEFRKAPLFARWKSLEVVPSESPVQEVLREPIFVAVMQSQCDNSSAMISKLSFEDSEEEELQGCIDSPGSPSFFAVPAKERAPAPDVISMKFGTRVLDPAEPEVPSPTTNRSFFLGVHPPNGAFEPSPVRIKPVCHYVHDPSWAALPSNWKADG